jgi:U3 small nucleolar RNA-associated protein 10
MATMPHDAAAACRRPPPPLTHPPCCPPCCPAPAGLDQLCTLDGRFQAYRRTLFGQASQALDRDASTQEVNSKLDAAIAGFCTLLSSYFLLAPAFKALEYLVRKYQ